MPKIAAAVFFIIVLGINLPAGLELLPEDASPGWPRAGKPQQFIKENLFNYIDGGAELFLEFGFWELVLQRYRQGADEISLEIYRMESPEAALGIYLQKRGRETPWARISARNSGDRFQLTVLKDKFFILVNNFAGDEKGVPVMTALVQKTLALIPEGRPVMLLDLLPRANRVPDSELLIRGPYSLQRIVTLGEGDILRLGPNLFGVAGDYYGSNGTKYTRILVIYPDPGRAAEAFRHLLANLDPYLEVLEKNDQRLVFRDWGQTFGSAELKASGLEIRVHLVSKPTEPPG